MIMRGPQSPHTFHIPVMGSGFSIDTPLRVAKYGISSVVSLVDDVLIEQMRRFHCEKLGVTYDEIDEFHADSRAERITAYLNLLDDQVNRQLDDLRKAPFEPGSDITRYFEMLPDSELKSAYTAMLNTDDPVEKKQLQDNLRQQVQAGSIDVNIMTKLDRDIYKNGVKQPPECSDAMAALRGYANSRLNSSIIFSAGINPRLYGYLGKFNDFFPCSRLSLKKKIVLKVSDFRSALIQGKYLVKRGLWVSEFRVESGLNCGGHAFASEGYLMGPILEEFKKKKDELIESLHATYTKALEKLNRPSSSSPYDINITVQGGIGTAEENNFLMKQYNLDGTGWGTPFLLVPEVTNVDDAHLEKLKQAGDNDVFLSDSSPLGVPFWNLYSSASEQVRRKRIEKNKPGSPCPKGFLVSNTEFTEVPICHASRVYQKKKLRELEADTASDSRKEHVMAKSCICHDLGGGATLKNEIDTQAVPAVCCGPNIVNFSKVSSLEEMVGHIYGRLSLLTNPDRPHVFIKELALYVDHFKQELHKTSEGLIDRTSKSFELFKSNLNTAISYYRGLAEQFTLEQRTKFLTDLDKLFNELEQLLPESTPAFSVENARYR